MNNYIKIHIITSKSSVDQMNKNKWILVVAARPNFMKIAPLIRAIKSFNKQNSKKVFPLLVHTGQHYDVNMSDSFFRDLKLPKPDIHLGVGSGMHGEQTGKVLIEFEKVILKEKPDLVIVVGDVNSTLACALAAVKLNVPLAHVESGLRSFDRRMPEEINRIVTDSISDFLFTPSEDGTENLLKEGIQKEKIYLVGDIMIDSLLFNLPKAEKTGILKTLSLNKFQPDTGNSENKPARDYCLLTLHRPGNVDDRDVMGDIIKALLEVSRKIPIIFPVHPRTKKRIIEFELDQYFEFYPLGEIKDHNYYSGGALTNKIHCIDPLGYLDFLNLMAQAKFVLTDSGGIQEETTVLNIPCVTIRDTTERPVTITQGTNVLVGHDSEKIIFEAYQILDGHGRKGQCPSIWDGRTAERIVDILADEIIKSESDDENNTTL